ncbi:MAG: UDP-N-acetylmuramate--L-alanine ligase [Planctomycetes bacterium]|nr:UDP-N-acetylmuramate--L-alanine ligase [Planctomycetota bacterium]
MESVTGKKYHFIGIGGIGTSGLAKLLIKHGASVSGSDMSEGAVLNDLIGRGVAIHLGHRAENLPDDVDAVIISAAIPASNPELTRAGEKGLKIYKYAEMLGKVFDQYAGIAVCGTHGKSTTSAWTAVSLEKAGLNPSFIIGADIPQLGGSSGAGGAEWFVAEACEYDRSFLNLHPRIAAMLNIEADHLDYYRDEDEIVDAFADFARNIRPDGVLVANGRDRNIARILRRPGLSAKIVTFGLDLSCQFTAVNPELIDGLYHFDILYNGTLFGTTHISLPGLHNIENALAVAAMLTETGLPAQRICELLPEFTGTDRRLMFKGKFGGITVMDDYAHHPTEIRASLAGIRQQYQPHRLWCVFQPHQYSRTRFLLDDFAESFKLADITIVPEIYFVRDTAESKSKVSAEALVERIRQSGSDALFINDFGGILEHLQNHVEPGDLVVTMGAGTIWKVADEYLCWLGKHC